VGGRVSIGAITPPLGLPLSPSAELRAQELVDVVMSTARTTVNAQSLVGAVMDEAVADATARVAVNAQSLVCAVMDEAVAGATAHVAVKARLLVEAVMDEAVAGTTGIHLPGATSQGSAGHVAASLPWRYPSGKILTASTDLSQGPKAALSPCDWPSDEQLVSLEALASRLQRALPHLAAAATTVASPQGVDHAQRLLGAIESIERCAGA